MVAYFSKRLNDAEENYTANDRELLGLVYFLKRFRCYLEGSEFEVITDNQVLKHFFTKPHLSRREARWLDFLAQFSITKLALKPGRLHVLGDALSRIPHKPPQVQVSNVQAVSVQPPPGFEDNYEADAVFGPIIRAFRGDWPADTVQK